MSRFLLSSLLVLLSTTALFSQSGEKLIRVADLPETVNQQQLAKYIDVIDKSLEKLARRNPRLRSWNLKTGHKSWSSPGKLRETDTLIYGQNLIDRSSSIYLDRFGPKSLYLYIKILPQRRFAYISGSGAGSFAHGRSVAGGCLIAAITSANPRDEELEEQIKEIVLAGTINEPCR